jgi:hypothetical protein
VRSVWNIATQPYPEAHFATFPEELARRCIAAGTSERGKCPECGAPWVREVERDSLLLQKTYNGAIGGEGVVPGDVRHRNNGVPRTPANTTVGWRSSCGCVAPCSRATCACEGGLRCSFVEPATILDPFAGSGTTLLVARKLGRHAVGIDLNKSYLQLAARRLQQQSLFAEASGV